jgi:transketolase
MITLTPWDATEIWHLLVEGLKKQPAVLAPFVTRPEDIIVDRTKLKLPDSAAAIKGVYAMRKADMTAKEYHGTLVLQGNGVATIFVSEVLEKLDAQGINMNVYYVASTELFGLLPDDEQEKIFPEKLRMHSFGMSDFTLPTMYKWIRSEEGIRRTLYPFRKGHYLGSGSGAKVLEEAGIHAAGQVSAILDYSKMIEKRHKENKL